MHIHLGQKASRRWIAVAVASFLAVLMPAFPPAAALDENSPGNSYENISIVSDLDFRPEINGFNFSNYGPGARGLTPDEIRRLFGDGVCINSADGRCNLGPIGTYWMEFINSLMDGGHCMGLATLSLLFFEGLKDPSQFGAISTHDLILDGNEPLQREIAYWFAMQAVDPASSSKIRASPNEILDILERSMDDGDHTFKYTMSMSKPDGSGGHAVTPFSVISFGNGTYWIMVYDNNIPDLPIPVVVNTSTNTWMSPIYEGFEGDAKNQSLNLYPISSQLSIQDCPFCMDSNLTYCNIWTIGTARLLIEDTKGRRLGFVDGKLINEIPGADAWYPLAGQAGDNGINSSDMNISQANSTAANGKSTSSPVYKIPYGWQSFDVSIEGMEDNSRSNLAVISPEFFIVALNISLDKGQKDDLWFSDVIHSQNSAFFSYRPSRSVSPDLGWGALDNDSILYFVLGGFDLDRNASIAFSMRFDNNVSFETSGASKTSLFDFGAAFINQTERKAAGQNNISMPPDSRAIFDPQGWLHKDKLVLEIFDLNRTLIREVQLENGTEEIFDV